MRHLWAFQEPIEQAEAGDTNNDRAARLLKYVCQYSQSTYTLRNIRVSVAKALQGTDLSV
jgi:hypothetical protein